jgi:flagellar hook protein FlgE
MSNYTVALSGLQNTSLAIDTVSNNIANANTVGYKAGEYVFADQFVKAINPADQARVGMGTQSLGVRRPMLQGTITNSANPLDLAISGKGMFRLLQGSGTAGSVDPSAVYYSRNGQFGVDKEGYIVNENGMYLTGYQPTPDGEAISDDLIKNNGLLRMPNSNLPGNETTYSRLSAMLDSTGNAFTSNANVAFDPSQSTFNDKTTQTVFDNEGNSHTLEVYYRRVNDKALTITIGANGYTYSPGPSSSPNTLGATSVTLNQNSVLRVDTAPLATTQSAGFASAGSVHTLTLSSPASSANLAVDVAGKRVFVNGVDTGVTVTTASPATGTSLTLSGAINASSGAAISFYPAADVTNPLNMTLIAPDGTEITVQGTTNRPGSNATLTTTMAEVEVYASIDGRFYGTDTQSSTNRTSTAMNPQTPNSGNIAYKPVSKLDFIGGRNIDSLVTDPVSGNPMFKTTSTLSTRVTNQAGGSSDLVFDLDLSDTSLQAGAFQITHSNQNGEPLARLTNVTVDNQGRIVGVYGTGKQQFVGQVALVHFDNAEGLIPVGKNAFAASVDSGTEHSADGVLVGRAGTGIFGDIKGQALESSNVDLANELVRLMVLQRSYSANSQSMKAFDQTLRDTLQMVS